MSDLISREDALKEISDRHKEAVEWFLGTTNDEKKARVESALAAFTECYLTIQKLPSAEKKGKWERSDDPWKAVCSFAPCKTAICSVCKLDTFDRIDYAKKHYKFCPFCGAKMEVTE